MSGRQSPAASSPPLRCLRRHPRRQQLKIPMQLTLPLQLPVCRQANLKGVKCKCEYLPTHSFIDRSINPSCSSTFSDETRGGGGSTSDLSSVAADELTPVAAAAPPPPASNRHSTIVEEKVLELDSNGVAAVEGNGGTAEWRRGGRPRRQLRGSASASCYSSEVFRQQQQHFESSRPPLRPDAKSDIWSFGCLLFEVLTGTKLFSSGASLGSGKSKASSGTVSIAFVNNAGASY